jgi:hypothetical protein
VKFLESKIKNPSLIVKPGGLKAVSGVYPPKLKKYSTKLRNLQFEQWLQRERALEALPAPHQAASLLQVGQYLGI